MKIWHTLVGKGVPKMQNVLKIAISLPKEEYYKIEQLRKKLGFARSTIIEKAIRFWLGYLEKEDMVRRYELGYKKKPESLQEIKAWEKASADAFKEEGLK